MNFKSNQFPLRGKCSIGNIPAQKRHLKIGGQKNFDLR